MNLEDEIVVKVEQDLIIKPEPEEDQHIVEEIEEFVGFQVVGGSSVKVKGEHVQRLRNLVLCFCFRRGFTEVR